MRIIRRKDTTSIAEDLEKRFKNGVEKIQNLETCQPLFEEHEVNQSPYVLDRMLRTICVQRGITKELWNLLCFEYCYKVLALTKKQSNNKANNAVKAFKRSSITMQTFDFFRKAIGLKRFVFVKFGFIDDKNQLVEYTIDMTSDKKNAEVRDAN